MNHSPSPEEELVRRGPAEEAKARIVAAAPEMLTVLEQFFAIGEEGLFGPSGPETLLERLVKSGWFDKAIDVVAKARGSQREA